MRRSAALIPAALATALLLAGCAGDTEPSGEAEPTAAAPASDEPSEEDVAALAAVQVEGPLGEQPTLTFDQPFEVGATVARVDVEGTGEPLEDGQALTIDYVMVEGDDGDVVYSTWELGAAEQITAGDPTGLSALNEVLAGERVGARVLVARPGMPATAESEATPSAIVVLEVVGARTVPTRAEGETVTPPEGLPQVTLAEDGRPSIEVPADAEKPDELVVQTLIEGDGPVVEAGQNIVVHYNGWLWDGTLFDSSWDSGQPFPTPIGAGRLIQGWDEGLVGQTIGSQVLLVIPPDMGYGAQGMGDIPPDATLIFVVDLLDAA